MTASLSSFGRLRRSGSFVVRTASSFRPGTRIGHGDRVLMGAKPDALQS
jgi:hypothetical protein